MRFSLKCPISDSNFGHKHYNTFPDTWSILFCSILFPRLFQFSSEKPIDWFVIISKSLAFSGNQQEPVDTSFNHTRLIQQVLRLQEALQTTIHGEARELPFNDPGKPHQRAHIIEPDRPEALPSIQNLKTSLGESIHCDLQILIRKGQISLTA